MLKLNLDALHSTFHRSLMRLALSAGLGSTSLAILLTLAQIPDIFDEVQMCSLRTNMPPLVHPCFRGELNTPDQGQMLVYKCHHINIKNFMFGILIIRNPYDSLLSYYAYLSRMGKMGILPLESYRNNTRWLEIATKKLPGWGKVISEWYSTKHPFMVVHYEDLVKSPIPSVKRMLKFMNFTLTTERYKCLQKNIEGDFHRQHPEKFQFDPFTNELHELINNAIRVANVKLISRNVSPVHAPAYNSEF
ncbi:sialate:O-sulfotransferase 1-like [Saccoglossus kowalevskii]